MWGSSEFWQRLNDLFYSPSIKSYPSNPDFYEWWNPFDWFGYHDDVMKVPDGLSVLDVTKIAVIGYLALAVYSEIKSPTQKRRIYKSRGLKYSRDNRGGRSYEWT